jgi:hypothetical protein
MTPRPEDRIVYPGFRPLDRGATSPKRRRSGVVVLAVGIILVLVSDFVLFGQWIFAIGASLMLLGMFLMGPFRFRAPKEPEDIRKLYGHK